MDHQQIAEEELKPGKQFDFGAKWLTIHYIRDRQVWFAVGNSGEKYGYARKRIDTDKFLKLVNEQKRIEIAAPPTDNAG